MPAQREAYPYKSTATQVFSYIYIIGVVMTITGEKIGTLALIVGHVAHSLIANAPRHEDRFKEGTSFDQ